MLLRVIAVYWCWFDGEGQMQFVLTHLMYDQPDATCIAVLLYRILNGARFGRLGQPT